MSENRLGGETSPYLLQHAANPVHWRPWGPAALAEARARNRPILLSIGYMACHWCHVMAHESFENPETAALMNELFVNVKVDREERPDLDTIYQHALAMLGQQGGWPLTMFLTPDGAPFWGGTYFPPEGRFGRPGFRDLLRAVDRTWRDKPEAVEGNAAALRQALAGLARSSPGGGLTLDLIERAARRLAEAFDRINGGLGTAPKFPNPPILELLWRTAKRTGDRELSDIVLTTLERMCQGGIYDHLGGGFARYSTDALWLVPHFEKMLYDNAQLVELLLWAWQDTGTALFRTRIEETVAWVLGEMIAEGGAFAAAIDADSEGEEGRYYVWTASEIARLLGDDAEAFAAAYDVTPAGNWEGRTILNRSRTPAPLDEAAEARLARCRAVLLEARGRRTPPGRDDKVLADWNGLMIAALAQAGAALGRTEWIEAAAGAFRFVAETMAEGDRLRHSWRAGRAGPPATLDDYAAMARAALALHEVAGETAYLDRAAAWMAVLDDHFRDPEGGGYFFTADDAEPLIVRPKSADDNATPSGNGMAAANLARLYYLTGDDAYRARAEATIAAFSGTAAENVFPLATLMNAAELLQCALQVVIVGDPGDPACRALSDAAFAACQPNRVLAVVAADGALPAGHPARGKGPIDGRATAYLCRGTRCSLPLTAAGDLIQALRSAGDAKSRPG